MHEVRFACIHLSYNLVVSLILGTDVGTNEHERQNSGDVLLQPRSCSGSVTTLTLPYPTLALSSGTNCIVCPDVRV